MKRFMKPHLWKLNFPLQYSQIFIDFFFSILSGDILCKYFFFVCDVFQCHGNVFTFAFNCIQFLSLNYFISLKQFL